MAKATPRQQCVLIFKVNKIAEKVEREIIDWPFFNLIAQLSRLSVLPAWRRCAGQGALELLRSVKH